MTNPLHSAIIEDQLEACELLLRYGANINNKNRLGDTPLHIACYTSNEDIVALLLSYDTIDIIAENDGGYIPLDIAIDQDHRYIIDILIDTMKREIMNGRD